MARDRVSGWPAAWAGRPSCSKGVSTLQEHVDGGRENLEAANGAAHGGPPPEGDGERLGNGAGAARQQEEQGQQAPQGAGERGDENGEGFSPDGALKEAPQAELLRAKEQVKVLEAQLHRLMADFDNYRRRARAEAERVADETVERMTRPLLAVVDDLERTLAAIPDDPQWSSVAAGIKMVHQKLLAALEAAGIQAVAALGEPFDPTVHQAVDTLEVTDPSQDGRVVEELQRGFMLKGRVVRPAMVKVGVLKQAHEPQRPAAQQPASSQTIRDGQEGITHE